MLNEIEKAEENFIAQLKKHIKQLSKNEKEIQKKLNNAVNINLDFQNDIKVLNNELSQKDDKILQLTNYVENLLQIQNQIKDETIKFEQKKNFEIDSITQNLKQINEQKIQLQKKNQDIENQIKVLTESNNIYKEKNNKLEQQLIDINKDLQDQQNLIIQKEEEKENFYQQQHQALIKQQEALNENNIISQQKVKNYQRENLGQKQKIEDLKKCLEDKQNQSQIFFEKIDYLQEKFEINEQKLNKKIQQLKQKFQHKLKEIYEVQQQNTYQIIVDYKKENLLLNKENKKLIDTNKKQINEIQALKDLNQNNETKLRNLSNEFQMSFKSQKKQYQKIERNLIDKIKILEVEKASFLNDMEQLNNNAEQIQQNNFELQKENKLLLNKILNKQQFPILQQQKEQYPTYQEKKQNNDDVENFFDSVKSVHVKKNFSQFYKQSQKMQNSYFPSALDELAKFKSENNQLQIKIQEKQQQLEQMESILDKLKQDYKHIIEITQSKEKQSQQNNKKLEQYEQENKKQEQQIKQLTQQLEKKSEQNEKIQEEVKELQYDNKQIQEKNQEYQFQIKDLTIYQQEQQAQFEEEREKLLKKFSFQENELRRYKNSQQKIQEFLNNNQVFIETIEKLEYEKFVLEQEIEKLKIKNERLDNFYQKSQFTKVKIKKNKQKQKEEDKSISPVQEHQTIIPNFNILKKN